MIRLTKQTDYALVILTHMAGSDPEAVHTARDLAEITRIPLPMVSKILKILVRQQLLVSHRGAKGGYSLAAPAASISVAGIIGALEGPISLTECTEHTGGTTCVIESLCPTSSNLRRISRAVTDALEGISLDELARPLRDRNARLELIRTAGLPQPLAATEA